MGYETENKTGFRLLHQARSGNGHLFGVFKLDAKLGPELLSKEGTAGVAAPLHEADLTQPTMEQISTALPPSRVVQRCCREAPSTRFIFR